MPARVSTGDRDAVLRQIRWYAAVQTLVNCHCWLEENPVGVLSDHTTALGTVQFIAIHVPRSVCPSVCLSVSLLITSVNLAKTNEPIKMPFGGVDFGGTKESCR